MKKLILFDIDGTITPSRKKITNNMIQTLKALSQNPDIEIGFVGGSDLDKQIEQLEDSINDFLYWFPENGLVAYKNKEQFHQSNLLDNFTEEELQFFIKASLNYIADLKIPQKRGTFFEFRTGVINICPVGRNCSQEERDAFEQYDNEHNIRKNMITHLKEKFPNNNLHYSIGGQISFDVFPKGWDKTFCLNHLQLDDYQEIHFIGDKTHQGGNDHEIYEDKRTIGHRTNNPEETIQIIEQILK